jgi:hydroxymethylbilane synthase
MSSPSFILGSRKSDLALWQAREVERLLSGRRAKDRVKMPVVIETEGSRGDVVLDTPLSALAASDPGIFTKELEVGLLMNRYDLCVHSLKDMPTTLPTGLCLAGISRRDDPRDAVVMSKLRAESGLRQLSQLPPGAVVGTSSVRREATLKRDYPHLIVKSVRGNLNTRIRKLDGEWTGGNGNVNENAVVTSGSSSLETNNTNTNNDSSSSTSNVSAAAVSVSYDALILAAAGLSRMGWAGRISSYLSPSEMPHCVGQGALGLEARLGDASACAIARIATHGPSALRCLTERAFLNKLQGGCQVPIGVHTFFGAGEGGIEERANSDSLKEAGKVWSKTAPNDTFDDAPSAPECILSLTIVGTVSSVDGGVVITGQVTEPVMVPDADAGAGAEFDADGNNETARQVDGRQAVITEAQWNRMIEDGKRIGHLLAEKLMRAGAAEILGSGEREITYGAAETPLDRRYDSEGRNK